MSSSEQKESIDNKNKGVERLNSDFKDAEQLKRDGLTNTQVWAYAVGHFNNDLHACILFSYLAVYLKNVIHLESS